MGKEKGAIKMLEMRITKLNKDTDGYEEQENYGIDYPLEGIDSPYDLIPYFEAIYEEIFGKEPESFACYQREVFVFDKALVFDKIKITKNSERMYS